MAPAEPAAVAEAPLADDLRLDLDAGAADVEAAEDDDDDEAAAEAAPALADARYATRAFTHTAARMCALMLRVGLGRCLGASY